jgi:hypothetical protein
MPTVDRTDPRYDDEEFDVDNASVPEAFDYWRSECAHARAALATFSSLDDVGFDQTVGAGISVRSTLVHMIEEYARPNGHADLLREAIDGPPATDPPPPRVVRLCVSEPQDVWS